MWAIQGQVREFREKMGQVVGGGGPAIQDEELCARLIEEEAGETVRAIRNGDLVAAVDGLCDAIYVLLGAAVAWGVDLEPIFDEVHRANMAKADGPVREDGKRLKPPGWSPPDVAGLLDRQYRRATAT